MLLINATNSFAVVFVSLLTSSILIIKLRNVRLKLIIDLSFSLSVPLKDARENFEKKYLSSQLKKFGGNISKMAKFIGMERSALHRKLKGLNIKDLN